MAESGNNGDGGKMRKRISSARTKIATFIATDDGVPAKVKAEAESNEGSALRSLSPQFEKDEHEGYVQLLLAELKLSGTKAPRNIALTGHYGSGKSSVLTETANRLRDNGFEVANLSLPSLGIGNGRLPKDGEQVFNTTNLIQKEIVKQLLYRRRPSDMPASRYSRLDIFNERVAKKKSRWVGVLVAGLGALLSFPARVEAALPAQAWAWLDDHLLPHTSIVLQWLSLLVLYLLVVPVASAVQRLLQQRLRVTELGAGAGPARLKLSEPSSSYFDEYLDEIVYFFQTSKTTIVVFEDLDRFKNPQIFETLRELNLLLNNAEQTGVEPIRFVYAIRDSIFEQLEDATAPPSTPATMPSSAGEVNDGDAERDEKAKTSPGELTEAEARRLITTNRTKFFDLVVPVVPFISHRTSRTLMHAELKSLPPEHDMGREVVDLVGSYITDMRLIKNICNEFDVFRTRIIRDEGLDLKPDKLFASVVYKNMYLGDYEHLRTGDSLLDKVYGAYREWVTQQIEGERSTERNLRAELRRLDSIGQRSTRIGERLQTVLAARISSDHPSSRVQVTTNGTSYGWDDLVTPEFWRSFLDAEDSLAVNYDTNQYSPPTVTLPFAKVARLIGEPLKSSDWAQRDRQELEEMIAESSKRRLSYSHASMHDAITATDDEFTIEGDSQTLNDYAKRVFEGAPMVVDLLRAGFIDENFTLYVTQFPGDSSASATNFAVKAVQANQMDIDYHFGSGDAVDIDVIREVLSSEASRIFNGKSIYNRELFDYLLAIDPTRLIEPIRRLAGGGDDAKRFVDAYVESGEHSKLFVSMLSARWTKIFDYLVTGDPESVDVDLLDSALKGADASVAYDLTDEQREVIDSLLSQLDLTKQKLSPEQASAVAAAIDRMGVVLTALDEVEAPLRTELLARSSFALNRRNLQAAVGDGNAISLDSLRALKLASVYNRVLENLRDYLALLEKEDPAVPTVVTATRFVAVLEDVGRTDPELIGVVAARAEPACTVDDITELQAGWWPAIAAANRLTLSASNVIAYIAEHSIDSSLAGTLAAGKALQPNADEPVHAKLALQLLDAELIAETARLSLVESLDLDEGAIDPASLSESGRLLIPQLVQMRVVTDDANAFEAISGDSDEVKQRLMTASKAFPTYLPDLTLETQDVHIVSWSATPDAAKAALLDHLDSFSEVLGKKGASGLARWAASVGHAVSEESVELLASKADSSGASAIVSLLGDQAPGMDLERLRRTLTSLGGKYGQLAQPGKDRPDVPDVAGMESVLLRLRKAGIVSKFVLEAKKNRFRVSKHHS